MSLSDTKIKDIMTKAVISVDPNTSLFQVAKMMEQGSIGAIIVKKNGQPEGIITDRDFAVRIAVQKQSLDTPVQKVASYPLYTIPAGESILQAAKTMSAKKIRKLAAVEGGSVVGIITATDLVNHLARA